ncbi:PucR family transcriptional regulator [Streptomyces sp. NBC_01465]|uniref:PucR family transcriptional regulator n=1 Tax=Streptomyces sp. NBC_01465 TaxID=2903878 RepID=UPI002E2F02D5|nr:helix-turn-helix domain-containing protein [Streptomyces sp. NBC_01465]
MLAEVSATGRRPTRAELTALRTLGAEAAGAGYSLRTLVGGCLAAARTTWPASSGSADRVLAAMEHAVDALAEGFEQAQYVAVRQDEAARRQFIADLLHRGSDVGHLAERAERFGLRLSHDHAVAVVQGAGALDEHSPVARSVELAVLGRFDARGILLTAKDGRLVCIAPGDQDDVLAYFAQHACDADAVADGTKVAVGRPHPGAGGIAHSYEEALNALHLAERLDLPGPVLRAADLLVYPVLARDRDALADLVEKTLGPLQEARGGAQPFLDTLAAYFNTGCVAAEAARRLALSVRAFTYRLERIGQLTGADPSDPVHRYTLQTAVIGARLLDWPLQA